MARRRRRYRGLSDTQSPAEVTPDAPARIVQRDAEVAVAAARDATSRLERVDALIPDALRRQRVELFLAALNDGANPIAIIETFDVSEDGVLSWGALGLALALFGGLMLVGWRVGGSILGSYFIALTLASVICVVTNSLRRKSEGARGGSLLEMLDRFVSSMLVAATLLFGVLSLWLGTEMGILAALFGSIGITLVFAMAIAGLATLRPERYSVSRSTTLWKVLDAAETSLARSDGSWPDGERLYVPGVLLSTSYEGVPSVAAAVRDACEARVRELTAAGLG